MLYPIWRIGSRLPVVMGVSFTFAAVLSTIAAQYRYPAVGYAAAIFMGKVDLSTLLSGGVVARPRLMLFLPEFHWRAIISARILFLVSAAETIGDTSALVAGAPPFCACGGGPLFPSLFPDSLFLSRLLQ